MAVNNKRKLKGVCGSW